MGTGLSGQGSPGGERGQKAVPLASLETAASQEMQDRCGRGMGHCVPLTVMHGPTDSAHGCEFWRSCCPVLQALGNARLRARCKLTPFVLPIVVDFYTTRVAYSLASSAGTEAARPGSGGGCGPSGFSDPPAHPLHKGECRTRGP